LTEFSFKTIKFIHDDIPKNEAGVLFKYRTQLLQDNPEYLMVMRYNLCSSFPLHELIAFHKQKEVEMGCSEDDEREEGNNRALLTVMTARVESDSLSYGGQKNYGMFAIEEGTQEILHYSEEVGKENTMKLKTHESLKSPSLSPPVNCGVYLFSVRFYEEVGFPAK
jgi:hypothetical protein